MTLPDAPAWEMIYPLATDAVYWLPEDACDAANRRAGDLLWRGVCRLHAAMMAARGRDIDWDAVSLRVSEMMNCPTAWIEYPDSDRPEDLVLFDRGDNTIAIITRATNERLAAAVNAEVWAKGKAATALTSHVPGCVVFRLAPGIGGPVGIVGQFDPADVPRFLGAVDCIAEQAGIGGERVRP